MTPRAAASRVTPRRSTPPTGNRAPVAGYAVVLLLVVLVLGTLYGLLASVDAATAKLEQRRQDETQQILRQAKDALIAWSAVRPDSVAPVLLSPGHLPCPDLDNDGQSTTNSCNGSAGQRTGRLPWKTLGLPDLRDPSGERLWYAVSRCFLELAPDGFCDYAVNSDTLGQLTVTGLSPATNVIAIIFAPGPALGGQDRTGANVNVAANYLEGENGDASNDTFETRVRCVATDATCAGNLPFNDQMILITQADLFDAVENVVAKRLESQIKPAIQDYFTEWQSVWPITDLFGASLPPGFYPFATPFDDQTSPATFPTPPTDPSRDVAYYRGRVGQTNGLLPVTRDATWMTWTSYSVSKLGGFSNFSSPPPPCTFNATALTCSFSYQGGGGMTVLVRGTVANVARSFARPINEAGISVSVSGCCGGATSPSLGKRLDTATGNLHVNYQFDLPGVFSGSRTVTVQIPTPQFVTFTQDTDPTVGWFVKNHWQRLTYYAVSPSYVLGGSGTCSPPPATEPCIQVQNAPAPTDNKRVVLVLAGRNLAAGARTWTIPNYFESANSTGTPLFSAAPDYVFEQRKLRSTQFNDRVVVVSP